ncbi:RNA pol I and III 14K sub [Enterospora canceri]|uniref:RNA pol I and III 14K sub n=1 Tax=Enterospora canceri TaxID=1081671 RepID=A0A1Y1S662_9MICR|nr:RNA pol I and III 14K sub [Enterospora canceri]
MPKKVAIKNEMQIEIWDEDHTMMNLLRWIISSGWADYIDEETNEKVEVDFCGYAIPHPSERVCVLTVQFVHKSHQNGSNILNILRSLFSRRNSCR